MRGAGRLRVLCRRSAYRPWRTCCRRCDRLCCSNLPERDSLRAGAHFSPGTDRQRHRRENLHRYQWKKNLIGTFYQPKAVYVDPAMVRTLPTRFFHNGLGEAIKIGCVADKDLFEIFEKAASDQDILRVLPEIIRRCITIKAHYVEIDPEDKGERRILDFGHTLGGAAERYYRFNDLRLTHGEATAAGMYMITSASEILGLTKRGTAERIKYVLQSIGLPINLDVPRDILVSLLEHGKNVKDEKIETPLVLEIGKGYIYTGEIETLKKYIQME